MNRKKKTKKKIIMVITGGITFIFVITLLFYYFLSDNLTNNFVFKNLKDLSASITYILPNTYIKNNNKELNIEINNDYKKEIEELKKTLKLNTLLSDKEYVNATVIKRSMNYWYNVLTIDKGERDGIKEGEAVINSEGLIGKIIKTNKHTSDIKLLISKTNDNYISAEFNIDNTIYYGLIDEYNLEKNELYLKNVIGDFNKEKVGDVNVLTSGLSDSFSSGLLIGKIKDVKKDTYGISNIMVITPSVNFNNLNIVTVVVGDR